MEKSVEIFKAMIMRDQEVKDYYQSVFNTCDTDRDGLVSVAELKKFLEIHEEIDIPENVLDSIYFKFDKNGDRQLDFEEFLEMINNKTFKETFQNVTNRILKFVAIPPKNRKIMLNRTITMTGTYEEEIRCKKTTVVMAILSVIQIICFYVNTHFQKPDEPGPLNTALCFNPCKKVQVYRYISYLLVHANSMHLYGNIIIQIIIGIPLETVHTWRVIVIYVVGALGGSLTHSVFDRRYALVGGSGGVFAFFTAHISVVIMNWREMSHPAVHLLLFGIVVVIDVFYNIFHPIDPSDMTSYLSHAGGAVVGLLFGVNILRNLRVTERENVIWYICLVTLGVLFIIFVTLDIALPREANCNSENITLKSDNYNEFLNKLRSV